MPALQHSAIIATCGRLQLLKRALISISRQSFLPHRLVVVVDQGSLERSELLHIGKQLGLSLEILPNRRTAGASGAWNTAFDHLTRTTPDPTRHVVSILDDDDWWESDYLSQVSRAAQAGAEVIATAITRHDQATPEGRQCAPPARLRASDFLQGNPGIQGSNLSGRLSSFLLAGLFDEALSSCTDRDLCIRLADLRPVYTALPEAAAHHDTLHGYARLSDKDSTAKLEGLRSFDRKWRHRMTTEQFEAFRERAQRLFGWTPPAFTQQATEPRPQAIQIAGPPESIALVIGTIIDGSKPERCRPLLDGLATLTRHHLVRSIDIVLLENGEADGFQALVAHGQALGLDLWPVDLDAQASATPNLPIEDDDVTRCKPIAIARTLLQRFVYEVSCIRHHAPAWILDDDFRIPNDPDELVYNMIACRDSGIDVALGGNSGSAPVPASSLLRTQLVDAVHFLQCATYRHPEDPMPDSDALNAYWLAGHEDYHYDLTRRSTDRLEAPFLPSFQATTFRDAVHELLQRAERLLAGEAISRPVLPAFSGDPRHAPDSCLRGGNTLVLDPALLRDIPNMAPRINGRPTRRSDMLWAATAKHMFGKAIKSIRLPMLHDRSMEPADADDTQRLIDDIVGYGFFRSYEETLKCRPCARAKHFSEEERAHIGRLTRKYSLERLAAYRLSFWRVVGLTLVLDNLAATQPWWLRDSPSNQLLLLRFHRLLNAVVDPAHLRHVEQGVKHALEVGEFMSFLDEVEQISSERETSVSPFFRAWTECGREACAIQVLQRNNLGSADYTLLGMGKEGVVLRAGRSVIKVFDRWTIKDRQEAAPIIDALARQPASGAALPEILNVYDWPEVFAVEYRFEESQPYSGGHGPELVTMLRELRCRGWVHNNVNPKNLRLMPSGLQLIDIGKSLELATPAGEAKMIRRAFLAWRFAKCDYLALLMRASLESERLPELTGWQALQEAVTSLPSKARLDEYIFHRTVALNPRTVLDYGCGKPRNAIQQARVHHLTVFDIDSSLRERWRRDAPGIPFWTTDQLREAITQGEHFDLIICALVLCAVDDGDMVATLHNLRRLAGQTGHVIVAVCDPSALHITHAVDQTRHQTSQLDAHLSSSYRKTVAGSASSRVEFHRPIEAYRRAFAQTGLRITDESVISGFDAEHLERVPEFLVFDLVPLPELSDKTSLLVKLCALEAETALHQVRHLERQLSHPRAFDEVVLLIDPKEGPFPRAHCAGDLGKLRQATQRLLQEGVVDRVLEGFSDGVEAAECARRWTGQTAYYAHCANGQPATSILWAIEECRGDYVLHADADVLIARPDPSCDHIAEAIRAFEAHPNAVTLALSVSGDDDVAIRSRGTDGQPYRVETLSGWIAKPRLLALRPLSGAALSGQLTQPWHRMLDLSIRAGKATSLRRGSQALWFAAADNARKGNVDDYLLYMDRFEAGHFPDFQAGQPLIQGPLAVWLGPKRKEPLVVVICGRNVRPGAIDRCLTSLREQTYLEWGAVIIDDASDNGSHQVLVRACQELRDRVTLIRRRRQTGLLANTHLTVRHLVASPDTVIVLLDLDDAFASQDALLTVAEHYRSGADLTVGTMLRTDKPAAYPVDFTNPRDHRGGNVWQHLRTFRKFLFDRIEPKDLKLDAQWIDLANDWAFMLPMVEMAQSPAWIRDVLYLHEPSTQRLPEEKAVREATIERIVAKPSYRHRSLLPPHVTVLRYSRVLETSQQENADALYFQHGMAVSASTLQAQLRNALNHFEPIRAADLLAAQQGHCTLPERALLVTVDGSYRDYIETVLPIIARMGIEPLLFARTPLTDGYPSWAPLDRLAMGRILAGFDTPASCLTGLESLLRQPLSHQLAEVSQLLPGLSDNDLAEARRNLYLSGDELASLPFSAIGTYGVDQSPWSSLSTGDLDDALHRSLAWLKEIGGLPVAAYPDGRYDAGVAKRLSTQGYHAAFTLDAVSPPVSTAYAIQCTRMPNDPEYVAQLIAKSQEDAI